MAQSNEGATVYPTGCIVVTGGIEAGNDTASGGASGGLARGSAVSAAGLWAGVSDLAPGHQSVRHHHGDQATIVYIVDGSMTFTVHGPAEPDVFTARSGDFVVVPAQLEHEEHNPDPERACRCVVVRTGEQPKVFDVATA